MSHQTDWHWGISNGRPDTLLLWLEPWADEIDVPCKSTVTLRVNNAYAQRDGLNVTDTGEHLVIWADAGDRIEVYVDGIRQHTASAIIPVPNWSGPSTKNIMEILFKGQPSARLAGQQSLSAPASFWQRVRRRFGF